MVLAGLVTAGVALAGPAAAQIATESVVYQVDGQAYEGYFARNAGYPGAQPLVILIHDWDGLGDYEKRRAEMLAELGYAAFAVDLYGQGVRPTTTEDKKARSGALYQDRAAMRRRMEAGLEAARGRAGVDGQRVAAMGYCFGGAAVLELARSGAELDGFVTFHAGLKTPADQTYGAVKGPLLILHGTNDPAAPMSEVAELAKALNEAKADYRMELYGGAKHAFTVWGVPDSEALGYDPQADRQSWREAVGFFDTVLR
ncbi:dienelactone hydrolase family protein [Azospirillum sp. ST 5-10]|uniref:dienelactone hydrolase family protein n=1 Tax=unclassified Azospirillum TaxID=2630922 RepID=UPI003F4A5177